MPTPVGPPPIRTLLTNANGALDQVWARFFLALQQIVARMATLLFDGTSGQVLTATGAGLDPIWQAPAVGVTGSPRGVAYHNTTQSVPYTTLTPLNLNSEDLDVGGVHDLAVNNTRLTVPAGAGGFYQVAGTVVFASTAAGSVVMAQLRKNGTTALVSVIPAAAPTGNPSAVQAAWVGDLAAADYVELLGYQQIAGVPAALLTGSVTRASANALSVVRLA